MNQAKTILFSFSCVAILYSCNTIEKKERQQYEVFYNELDSAEKAWIDNSKKTNPLHDSVTWFNVWHFAHREDSPSIYRRRLYFPSHNKK